MAYVIYYLRVVISYLKSKDGATGDGLGKVNVARKEVDVDERGEGGRLLPGYAATQKVIVHKIPVKR